MVKNQIKKIPNDSWTKEEKEKFNISLNKYGPGEWIEISKFVGTVTNIQCRICYRYTKSKLSEQFNQGPWAQIELNTKFRFDLTFHNFQRFIKPYDNAISTHLRCLIVPNFF